VLCKRRNHCTSRRRLELFRLLKPKERRWPRAPAANPSLDCAPRGVSPGVLVGRRQVARCPVCCSSVKRSRIFGVSSRVPRAEKIRPHAVAVQRIPAFKVLREFGMNGWHGQLHNGWHNDWHLSVAVRGEEVVPFHSRENHHHCAIETATCADITRARKHTSTHAHETAWCSASRPMINSAVTVEQTGEQTSNHVTLDDRSR
jgi:hypothetical protein